MILYLLHTYCMIAHAHEHISLDDLEVSDGRFLNNDTHYYETDQITKIPGITNHKYNALQINIRSLPTNIELLRTMLDQLNDDGIEIHFLLLCETFLNDANTTMPNTMCNKQVYLINRNRQCGSRGGVVIYIKIIKLCDT